jgi:hypothetical protein
MNKLNLITVIAGLTVAFTTIGAEAAIVRGRTPMDSPESAGQADCGAVIGHVRSVHRADIDAIDGQHVSLVRVCTDDALPSKNDYGPLFINGNVETLRRPIARNDTLISALSAQDMDQNDVVALRFGSNDSIILYVYDRDMN